jgi:hypothetical protein
MRQSREKLLTEWRQRVEQDPELTTASSITRSQFTDSIPKVLDAFEQALRADDAIRETQADMEQREGASEHGLHRWQQGYDLRETLREWAHLHQCILAELESILNGRRDLRQVTRRAREVLVRLCGEGASECRAITACSRPRLGRVRDLESAVTELRA